MKTSAWMRRLPWSVVLLVAALIVCGWIGISRAEMLRDELAGPVSRYVRQQIVFSLLAVAAMFAVARPNYRVLARYGYAVMAVVLALLVAVFFFPRINGAHRWIRVGPIGFQPAEFAKVALVLAAAQYLMYRENCRRLGGLLLPLALTMLPVLLILKEPDLGMSLVLLPMLLVMLFVAGARRADLAMVLLAAVAMLPVLWIGMSREQKSRVTALFEPIDARHRPSDDAYHLQQAERTLALGGAWGSAVVGQPTDDPAAYRLPEARTDFIFCALGERFGLWGLGIVLSLYGLLVWRGATIAAAAGEPFGRLVAAGVTAMIATQTLINVGMTVGLLPITGLSLPLVSYGGSGLLAHGVAIGLLLNVGARPGYELAGEPFRYVVGGP